MLHVKPVLGLALILSTSLFGSASHVRTPRESWCPGRTAAAIVRTYYRAIAQHHALTAQACLTQSYLASLSRTFGTDWTNVRSVRLFQLQSRSIPPSMLPGPQPRAFRADQVTVELLIQYYRVIDSSNGLNFRFIYVVRARRYSPWRIMAIGTGP